MKVWVSRDKTKSAAITIWNASEPVLGNMGLFYPDYNQGSCMADQMEIWSGPEFKAEFGFTPRKGTCKQYNLELTEIKI